MATADINRLNLTARLAQDPELKTTPSGASVCRLRIATSTLRKRDGEYAEQAHFFNVTVWGAQGEACAKHLTKGAQIALDGRLEMRQWDSDDGPRQAAEIIAENVKFLARAKTTGPSEPDQPVPAGVGAGSDEDIPF